MDQSHLLSEDEAQKAEWSEALDRDYFYLPVSITASGLLMISRVSSSVNYSGIMQKFINHALKAGNIPLA